MRIVVLSQFFPPEPARIVRDVTYELVRRGHKVHVVTTYPSYPAGSLYAPTPKYRLTRRYQCGYWISRVPSLAVPSRKALGRAAGYATFPVSASVLAADVLTSADAVYVYGSPLTAASPAYLNLFRFGVPYVVHAQDLWPDAALQSRMLDFRVASILGPPLGWWVNDVYRRASHVVAISRPMADELRKRNLAHDQISLVYNWADETRTRSPASPSDDMRTKWGISPRDFVALYAGNLGEYQGLEAVISAASSLKRTGLRLVIAGSGAAEESLRALAKRIEAENVLFVGRYPPAVMPSVSAAADVQVVSLSSEAFLSTAVPGKLPQIMAGGQPVIAALDGDGAVLVERSGGGWVANPGDATSLTSAFRLAMSARSDLADVGRQAKEFYEHYLSQHLGAQTVASVVESAAQHG